MVGALLVEPTDPDCTAGAIYFNAEKVLGMCGSGTIGLAATLMHTGRIGLGDHRIETPASVVNIEVRDANTMTMANVESYRAPQAVPIEIEGLGTIFGDVAYGGNWFFIVEPTPIAVTPDNLRRLTDATVAVRERLEADGITGDDGAPIDHVIFCGPAAGDGAHGRNFVLCPDNAYDCSLRGAGSSTRFVCLAADGGLGKGEEIVWESVIGGRYRLSYRKGPTGGVIAADHRSGPRDRAV